MQQGKFETSAKIPITYVRMNESENKPLVILLHGFADSAKSLLKRALPETPSEVEILAINGLFPVPQKKDGHWKHAFAWYFVDFYTREVHIHPNVSAQAISELLRELNLESRPKILMGFSQGGFFVPYLLKFIKNVKQILIVGSIFRPDEYPNEQLKIEALHGELDQIVSFEDSIQSFQALKQKRNIDGEYKSLPDMGHNFNDEAREWLIQKILIAAKENESYS